MAIGDPHIKSYRQNGDYQTCNALEYFEGAEKMQILSRRRREADLAAESILLLSNEWFSLRGWLTRWSAEVNGTYFSRVTLSVIENMASDESDDSYITYTYSSPGNGTVPMVFQRKTIAMTVNEFGFETEEEMVEDITNKISVS